MPLNFVTLNQVQDGAHVIDETLQRIVGLPADGMTIADAAYLHRKTLAVQRATRELQKAFDIVRQNATWNDQHDAAAGR
jgi:hypothetical protein